MCSMSPYVHFARLRVRGKNSKLWCSFNVLCFHLICSLWILGRHKFHFINLFIIYKRDVITVRRPLIYYCRTIIISYKFVVLWLLYFPRLFSRYFITICFVKQVFYLSIYLFLWHAKAATTAMKLVNDRA